MNNPADLDPQAVTFELQGAANKVAQQSGRLYHLTREFDGKDGELGVGKRYDIAIAEAKVALVEEALAKGEKPPGDSDYRAAKAELRVRADQPDLYADHHRLTTEMEAIRVWVRDQKASIEAKRSVLSAAKVLSGLGGG